MDTPKILLVEDNVDIQDIYSRQLTKAGFSVTSATDGAKALEELKNNTFDLLLLDIMLPNMNGLELLKEFKKINPNSPMKVIIVSNLGNDDIVKEGFSLGAIAYLLKVSCGPDEVVNQVKEVFDRGHTTTPFK